jgi:hypothetical protein
MAVIVPILSTFNPAGVNKAQRAFKGLSGTAKVSAVAFSALGLAATKFGVDAVKAAAADQKGQLKLAKTLQNVTKATDAQIASTEKFITTQQFATGVSDTQLRPSLETLVRATGDVTKAQSLLKLGLDVSAGSGRDLESISLALAKAQGGQFTALQRLGIVIPDNIKKSKDFGKVQEYLNKLFGGQAAVAANTFAGKMAILKQRLQEAQETIGGLLLPILTKLVDAFLNNLMPAIERVVNVIKFEGAGAGLHALIAEGAALITNLDGTAAKVKNLILIFLGIKTIAPLVYALRAAWVATSIAVGETATATVIASGVMKRALISTGIGAIVVALGLVVAKIYDIGIAAQSADKDITIATQSIGGKFSYLTNAAGSVVIAMDAISVAARHATDSIENNRLLPAATKQPKIKIPKIPKTPNGSKSAKASKAVAALAKTVADALGRMNDKLSTAQDKLSSATDAFKSFADGVAESINGLINFGDAANAETGSFLSNLQAQAKSAVGFADKVKQLISLGLSEAGIQQVLSAGADAGTKIADELIAGGADAISQTNALLQSVNAAAQALGLSGANAFYQAGVTQGQAMVNGIIAAIKKAGFTVVGGVAGIPAGLQKALDAGKLSKAQIKQVNSLLHGVPALAAGGIVTKPTLALIGEHGAEAVVPLSGRNAGTGATINLTVNAGMGANGAVIGREIVDMIKRYERVSGPVFKSA